MKFESAEQGWLSSMLERGRSLKQFPPTLNPSFTKPFGTHTFYQGGGGGGGGFQLTPSYLKNRCPHEREILQGI